MKPARAMCAVCNVIGTNCNENCSIPNYHRVHRASGFLSSRPNWPSAPSPASECCPPPPWFGGWGVGKPIRTKRKTLWYSTKSSIEVTKCTSSNILVWFGRDAPEKSVAGLRESLISSPFEKLQKD
jgi:hypothetical protein